jgi:hypothetical protein
MGESRAVESEIGRGIGAQMSEFAVASLRTVLMRALDAVERYGDDEVLQGWDKAFATMSRQDQADWLCALFAELTKDEMDDLPDSPVNSA